MKAFHSTRVILPGGEREAVVLVDDGIIKDIITALPSSNDLKLIELGNKILMPGVIDPHVHINEPGRTEWEGFDSATKAAIAGGINNIG